MMPMTNELYQLAAVAFCLLVAWCSDKLGISLELGAFTADVIISTSDLAEHTLHQIEPIRNLFTALFLASIGMLINNHFLYTWSLQSPKSLFLFEGWSLV